MSSLPLTALAVLVAAAGIVGCGGGGSASASGDPELTSCASRWNAERAAATGVHAYLEHQSTEALVTTIEVEGAESCAVIFAVAPEDVEYGTVGEVATLRGWLPMQGIGVDPRALQARGAAEANADVAADGTLSLR